jgi:osmotically-inducible protein OsmY
MTELFVTETSETARGVEAKAHACVQKRLNSRRPPVSVEFKEGLLFLRGRLASFYQKQLAQEAVSRLEEVDQVINHIEVVVAAC